MKTQKPRVAVLTKKVEAKKPAHVPAPRPRVQPTKAKLVPITQGKRMPIGPTPLHWMIVTMPEPSSAALTRATTWSAGNFRIAPTTSGTAMMPPSAASMCWAASSVVVRRGGRSSTLYSRLFIVSPSNVVLSTSR